MLSTQPALSPALAEACFSPSKRRQEALSTAATPDKRVRTSSPLHSAHPSPPRRPSHQEQADSSASSPATTPTSPAVKELAHEYMGAEADDLVLLIASMLTKLIAHNDQVPLSTDDLTRFHSRTPPGISVVEYLRRIVRYTNIEKSALLILLPYLDTFCAHSPSFTLSSLTVHRFLISSACVASKALCDSFCTNSHYAKVGGIKLDELNLLERGLIAGLGWKLTCEASLLQSYYSSLIASYTPLPLPNSNPSEPQVVYTQAPPPTPP